MIRVNYWFPSDDELIQGSGSLIEENGWQNPTPPQPGYLIYPAPWVDEDLPAGNLTATVDEYFWQNPNQPCVGSLIYTQPWTDEDLPAGNLTATVDEYYWQNPNQPINGSLIYPQQWPFEDVVIVPQPAPFQPDEDFWFNPVRPQPGFLYQSTTQFDDVVIVPQPAAGTQNYVGPAGARNYITQDIGDGPEF